MYNPKQPNGHGPEQTRREAKDALQLPTPAVGASITAASRAYGFPHPQAYAIQLDLMRALFQCIEQAHVGVFESPTGTGKSLSLACAALTWLEHNMQRSTRGTLPTSTLPQQPNNDDDVPDWVTAHALAKERALAFDAEQALSQRIQQARHRERQLGTSTAATRNTNANGGGRTLARAGHTSAARSASNNNARPYPTFTSRKHARPRKNDPLSFLDDKSDDQFLLTEADAHGPLSSGAEAELAAFLSTGGKQDEPDPDEGLTPELRTLMATYESATSGGTGGGRGALHANLTRGNTMGTAIDVGTGGTRAERELEELLAQETSPQVVFASRTHSQLAQFASEVRKTRFATHGLRVQPVRRSNLPRIPSSTTTGSPSIDIRLEEPDGDDTEGLPPDKPAQEGWRWDTVPLRTITLGSRAQLCINDQVRSVGAARGTEAMNETCREMLTAPSRTPENGGANKRRRPEASEGSSSSITPTPTDPDSSAAAEGEQTCRCPFAPPPTAEGLERTLEFRSHAFAQVRDIEDLDSLGRELGICPYFASRAAARTAHLVAVPYNLLLSAAPDQQKGSGGGSLKVQDNVVLIDEAHNLVDTVLGQYTLCVSLADAQTALGATHAYLARFATRLRGDNEIQVRRLVAALSSMVSAVRDWAMQAATHPQSTPFKATDSIKPDLAKAKVPSNSTVPPTDTKKAATSTKPSTTDTLFPSNTRLKPKETILTASQFVAQMGGTGDLINLAALSRFLHESRLLRKLSGYADQAARREAKAYAATTGQAPTPPPRSSLPVLHNLAGLLHSLARSDGDGRVLLRVEPGARSVEGVEGLAKYVTIKYQLLDAGKAFAPVVQAARAVALAGGTMSPVPPVVAQLFPTVSTESVDTLSCGHIIPARNVLTSIVSVGSTNKRLELTYDTRSDPSMSDELGTVLLNLCSVVPKGMVVFVPSYAVLAAYRSRWTTTKLLDKLSERKTLFYEPNTSAEVDSLLNQYSAAVHAEPSGRRKGALLFAVVGGKLSEGINFADDLARAVVMLGLPFPHAGSAELQERMRFARESSTASGSGSGSGNGDAGRELYMNMCMRSVNQSIGRAIRHANDHAALILVDARYARPDIQARLPGWITKPTAVDSSSVTTSSGRPVPCGLRKPRTFPELLKDVVGFFLSHK